MAIDQVDRTVVTQEPSRRAGEADGPDGQSSHHQDRAPGAPS